ncbi:hypothetical protein Clacol_007067 [Clathrus columnatus]|uniref:Uncharacterized protein n=1 Tax=Clathrus columnatus TaxID=1419009 RepID=A0AAV5AGR4_9AGAM|nr:hypothetical protein Clacol_007067 [Clathrus columnatus]
MLPGRVSNLRHAVEVSMKLCRFCDFGQHSGLENEDVDWEGLFKNPADEESPKLDKDKGEAPPEFQESSLALPKATMDYNLSVPDSNDACEEEKLRRPGPEEELLKIQEQGVEALLEKKEIFRKGQALLSETEMDSG